MFLYNVDFPDGAAYCLGTVNRDCWYLYTLNPLEENNLKRHNVNPEPDQTLEILMTDLDPEVMSIFTRDESSSAAEATQVRSAVAVVHEEELVLAGCLPEGKYSVCLKSKYYYIKINLFIFLSYESE